MSNLSASLSLRVAQKQILTPSLVQLVKILQVTRVELRDLINQELAENPVLEETVETDEATQGEIQEALEAERVADPSDAGVMEMMGNETEAVEQETGPAETMAEGQEPEAAASADSFDEIDFDSFFNDFLDPGFKSPAGEAIEKPSFDTFLSNPVTLTEHLTRQLALDVLSPGARLAAEAIIGNLDGNGYLTMSLDELAAQEGCTVEDAEAALKAVQGLDPVGVGARDIRECLLLQLEARGAGAGVAGRMVADYLPLVQTKQWRELARQMGRPLKHIEIAFGIIRRLDPWPGLKYSSSVNQKIEPDVYIFRDGDQYIVQLNDDDVPQLRLSPSYRRMLDKNPEAAQETKDARGYIRERYNSALQLLKNIEQRRQTITKVCQSIIARQAEMFDQGIDYMRPMMIKEVAEEIGVHPSTVSRAVSGKYAHTPRGVFELRSFFSEAVQGSSGVDTPLVVLKRKVKKMIEEEDPAQPLTDEQITLRLQGEGIAVTRRTVAKYREDLKIPSTHQRRRQSREEPLGGR
jgi:RNA polymerase sigma-54 factor